MSDGKKIIRKNCISYEIVYGNNLRADHDFIRFSSRSSVRNFLSGFLKDYFNVIMLRQIVHEEFAGSYLRRSNDQEIVDQITDLVMLYSCQFCS